MHCGSVCVCAPMSVCEVIGGWSLERVLVNPQIKTNQTQQEYAQEASDMEADRLGCSMINTTLMAAARPQKSMQATWAA